MYPAQEMYANSIDPLSQLFDYMCQDLLTCCLEGVELRDKELFHLCPLGVKGDWPFLVSLLL